MIRDTVLTVLQGTEGAAGALGTPAVTWAELGTVLASWHVQDGAERDGPGYSDWGRLVVARFPGQGLLSIDPKLLQFRHPDGTEWEVEGIRPEGNTRGAMVEARLVPVTPDASGA